jgi:hypothetical protein
MSEILQNQVLPQDFQTALDLGKQNEKVIIHELLYQGVDVIPTEGKHPFDFFLPDGRSVEVKLQLRSQGSGNAALETATMQRGPDLQIHTLTYAVVLTREQAEQLYMRGKIAQMGDYKYQDRYVRAFELKNTGVCLHQFIKSLK